MAKKLQTVLTAKDKTGEAFASINRSVKSFKNGIAGVSAAAAVAVAGVGVLVKKSLELTDSIDKASKAAGISAEGYQKLKFAASQAGIAAGQLDMSLLALIRRTGLAYQGNTTYAKTFDDLKVSVKNADGGLRDQEDVLEDVLLALSKVKDQADLTAKASVLFGDDAGKKMALLLQDGIEGLDAARDRAEELGLVLSQGIVDQGVSLTDAFNELKMAADAQTAKVILENAEALQKLVGWMGALKNWSIGVIADATTGADLLLKYLGVIDKTPLEAVRLEANLLKRDMEDMEKGSDAWKEAAARVNFLIGREKELLGLTEQVEQKKTKPKPGGAVDTGPLVEDKDAKREAARIEAEVARVREGLMTETQLLSAEEARLQNLVEKGGLTRSEATAALNNYAATLPSAINATEQAAAAQEVLNDLMADGRDITQSFLTPQESFAAAMGELNTLLMVDAISLTTYKKAVEQLKLESVLAADTMQGAMARAFQDIDYRMAQVDIFAGDMFGGMKNAAKSAVNEIISEFYRLVVIKPLMDMLFGGESGGLLGGLLGGFLGGGKAKGGHVSGGTAYLVGEEGPEIFRPNTSGDIVPNNKLAMARGGGDSGVTVVQNIRFDVGLESVDQRIEQATPRIANESARAVRDAQQRSGGEYI